MNAIGFDASAVGNHEFDEGVTELLRMQHGGCHPVDGCYFPDEPYAGADFQWLSANVVEEATGDTPLAYLQRTRVGAAKQMLESGLRTCDEVAYRVGYEDSGFFRKLFIKYTGLRPSDYRLKFRRSAGALK